MNKRRKAVLVFASGSLVAGCSGLQPKVDFGKLPATAAGAEAEYVIDNTNIGFYADGEWKQSSVSSGYIGTDYLAGEAGSGRKTATWNLNIVKQFEVYARWTSHPNRGSNVKYIVHHLNDSDILTTSSVEVNQRKSGGEWVKLGTYRMSALTGRVTVSDNANGYVIADAIMFKEVKGDLSIDSDNDGMVDSWELENGLDPTSALDAELDSDQDGLTNLQESLALTDPFDADTDRDGLSDGYEVGEGLDPAKNDSNQDADGDGYSNLQEYLAGTKPTNADSVLPKNAVLVSWEAPTSRADGSELGPEEIDYYELLYNKSSSENFEIISDDESIEFIEYGPSISRSSSTDGYVGSGYTVMPSGSGESVVSWSIDNVKVLTSYKLFARWTSYPNRATNAEYELRYVSVDGREVNEKFLVNQRYGGGEWQELGTFQPQSSQVVISLSNLADGYVIADAIRLESYVSNDPVLVKIDSSDQAYVIRSLDKGDWVVKIRAVDLNGVASDYSDPIVFVVE